MNYSWLLTGHVCAFLFWSGAMLLSVPILRTYENANEHGQKAVRNLEKSLGIFMDAGATLTILFGLILLFGLPGPSILKAGGFFHAKLLLIAVLIVFHVLIRKQIAKHKRNETTTTAPWLATAIPLVLVGIVFLMKVRPF